jgi:hypothetical protein
VPAPASLKERLVLNMVHAHIVNMGDSKEVKNVDPKTLDPLKSRLALLSNLRFKYYDLGAVAGLPIHYLMIEGPGLSLMIPYYLNAGHTYDLEGYNLGYAESGRAARRQELDYSLDSSVSTKPLKNHRRAYVFKDPETHIIQMTGGRAPCLVWDGRHGDGLYTKTSGEIDKNIQHLRDMVLALAETRAGLGLSRYLSCMLFPCSTVLDARGVPMMPA